MLIEKSWHKALEKEINQPYILHLKKFLEEEKGRGVQIFPPEGEVFNAFRQTPYDQVKVVLMGQDPYHGLVRRMASALAYKEESLFPLHFAISIRKWRMIWGFLKQIMAV